MGQERLGWVRAGEEESPGVREKESGSEGTPSVSFQTPAKELCPCIVYQGL